VVLLTSCRHTEKGVWLTSLQTEFSGLYLQLMRSTDYDYAQNQVGIENDKIIMGLS